MSASRRERADALAHELNNPLNAILLNAELALGALEGRRLDELERRLRTIIEQARRCGSVTRGEHAAVGDEDVPR